MHLDQHSAEVLTTTVGCSLINGVLHIVVASNGIPTLVRPLEDCVRESLTDGTLTYNSATNRSNEQAKREVISSMSSSLRKLVDLDLDDPFVDVAPLQRDPDVEEAVEFDLANAG